MMLLGVAVLTFRQTVPRHWAFAGSTLLKPSAARTVAQVVPSHALVDSGGGFLPLDAFEPVVSSYFANSPPLFQEMKDGLKDYPFTGHWAHAVGGSLLLLYGAYGVYLGWQIRLGNGGKVFPFSYDQTAAERHPIAMFYVLLFLAFEIPDGLTLLAANEQPLLQSTHASTAVVCLVLMAIVAVIGHASRGSKDARTAHAYLGSATVVALIAHAYFGLYLGWSF